MIAFDPSYDDSDLDPDTERMTRVAAGDEAAFDELVLGNFESTVRIISAMMGSSSHAEDLAQEVFMRIFRSRERYLPTAKFSTWLGTIIRNVVLNAKRSLSRNRVFAVDFSEDWSQTDGQSGGSAVPLVEFDPIGQLDQQQIVIAVSEAVEQLPRRQRTAIELVYFRGMTYSKAAREMHTSWKAVKSLLGAAEVRWAGAWRTNTGVTSTRDTESLSLPTSYRCRRHLRGFSMSQLKEMWVKTRH